MFGLKNLKDKVENMWQDLVDFKKLCFQNSQEIEYLRKEVNRLKEENE